MLRTVHKFEEKFFEEEIRNDFHVDRERKELWAVTLDLLYQLDRVCNELGIHYFLSNGTLIGAVRDGHFIPWDDDIDVMMFRKEYDILVKEGPPLFKDPYFLQTGYNDTLYFRGHSQLRNSNTCGALPGEIDDVPFNQGIFIDIFVLDYIHDELLEKQFRRKTRLRKRYYRYMKKLDRNKAKSILRRMYRLLLRIKYRNPLEFYREYEDVFRTEDSDEVEILMFRNCVEDVRRYKKEWFREQIRIPFEDGFFPAPIDYDKVLTVRYGKDYIVPKQIANTHSMNGSLIFDVNKSYKEVIEERKKGIGKK